MLKTTGASYILKRSGQCNQFEHKYLTHTGGFLGIIVLYGGFGFLGKASMSFSLCGFSLLQGIACQHVCVVGDFWFITLFILFMKMINYSTGP